MKKVSVLLLAAFLASCAYKHETIYNVNDPIPTQAQTLSLDKIESMIVEAGQLRHWTFERAAPGHLVATQTSSKTAAVVDIYFDQKTWRIAYKNSTGMNAENGTIHDHYNFWIRNLEHDVNTRLSNAGLTAN